jgi:hypothetical protein
MRKIVLLAALALASASPVRALATIFDTPPTLDGQKSLRVFTVPGVMTAGGLGTFFSCTNLSQAPAALSVQLYVGDAPEACNDADAVSVTAPPGATVLFSTQNTVDSSFPSSTPLSTPPIFMATGSASVLSTTKSVACSAWVADISNSPPLTAWDLRAVKKTQKGD